MASVDFFLSIDGIKGESSDSKHKEEIQIESWSTGANQSGTMSFGGGGGAGKVSMQDFNFVMKVNKASPLLMKSCATGAHIKKAVLTCRKAGKDQQEYMTVTLSDILVSSFQTGGSGGSDILPIDQVSLNYSKIEFSYKPQKADGSLGSPVVGGWDAKLNKAV